MSQGEGLDEAPTIIYAKLNLPRRSAPGGCTKLPGPWWYWVLLGAGWVGNVLLLCVMLWLLLKSGGNHPIQSQGTEAPTSNSSLKTHLTNTSQRDVPECNSSLNYFRQQLRQRLCEQGSQEAAGTSACWLCPAGWKPFAAQCYWVSTKTKTWEKAADDCSHQGSQLAALKSPEEKDFFVEMTQNSSGAWMGLSTNKTGGKNWTWQDGSPLQEAL